MKCSFCNSNMVKGTGKMFVKKEGSVFYFCSSKCEKNVGMGRVAKKMKWTKKQ